MFRRKKTIWRNSRCFEERRLYEGIRDVSKKEDCMKEFLLAFLQRVNKYYKIMTKEVDLHLRVDKINVIVFLFWEKSRSGGRAVKQLIKLEQPNVPVNVFLG